MTGLARLAVMVTLVFTTFSRAAQAEEHDMELSPDWEYVADTVMGGVSRGGIVSGTVAGREATRLTGEVSLENDGGFVQMAFDLMPDGGAFDARGWTGIELDVRGNDETYELRLRTTDLNRPWQSFRATFQASEDWTSRRFPFAEMEAHRTEAAFDASHLRRIGIVAIGRPFAADVAMSGIRLYR